MIANNTKGILRIDEEHVSITKAKSAKRFRIRSLFFFSNLAPFSIFS